MGLLEDLLKARTNHHSHHDSRHHDRHDGDFYGDYHKGSYGHGRPTHLLPLLEGLLKNKTLLFGIATVFIILSMLAIGAFIMLLPLLGSLFSSIEQGGLKGIVDTLLPILEKIWQGTGK